MATTTAPTDAAASAAPKVTIDLFKIPDWLLDHPELRKRGIIVHKPILPFVVYQTKWHEEGPIYVVKAIKPSRVEADIYELLDQQSDSPANHTIPHEVIRSDHPLVIMPFASRIEKMSTRKISSILAGFDQILEGVEHMHRLHIAHGDIFGPNVVGATEEDASRDARLTAGRMYLIDFETCRQFEHGPGVQTAVPLPNTHVTPPRGMKTFDPFSWDVYCLGRTLEYMTRDKFYSSTPWILGRLAQWLKGNEVGCTTVCHCRPTVTRARQVVAIIRWFVDVGELLAAVVTYPISVFLTSKTGSSRR